MTLKAIVSLLEGHSFLWKWPSKSIFPSKNLIYPQKIAIHLLGHIFCSRKKTSQRLFRLKQLGESSQKLGARTGALLAASIRSSPCSPWDGPLGSPRQQMAWLGLGARIFPRKGSPEKDDARGCKPRSAGRFTSLEDNSLQKIMVIHIYIYVIYDHIISYNYMNYIGPKITQWCQVKYNSTMGCVWVRGFRKHSFRKETGEGYENGPGIFSKLLGCATK